MQIESIKAGTIKNTKGNRSLKVEINGFMAMPPSGISTGSREAKEVDIKKALLQVKAVSKDIINKDFTQKSFDTILMEKKLGGNVSTGLSIAFCKAENENKLYNHISHLSGFTKSMPTPLANLIEGGAHASGVNIQEFLVIPKEKTIAENYKSVQEIFTCLKLISKTKKCGMEGGLVPKIKNNADGIELLSKAIEDSGRKATIGLDIAASDFFKKDKYVFDKRSVTGQELIDFYTYITDLYQIEYLEDPFHENDWNNFVTLTKKLGHKVKIVGDDLTTTNPDTIKESGNKKAINGVIIKINQIGFVTKAIESCQEARKHGMIIAVSHRGGETMDEFISDFSYGVGSEYAKIGAPNQKERIAKYKRLIQIENEI